MIDQNSQFFAILTNVGAAKQANANALGIAWKITQMGVGDANNTDPMPSATQTALINEWRRAPLNQLKVDPNNAAIIIAEQVIPADVGGRWIREIGLYDADGDLVAVANCAPSFKPLLNQGSGRTQVVRMNLQVSNASSVELKVDPSVVLATRAYVDQKAADELGRLDFKQSVRAAAAAAIVLSGLQTVDGVALVPGDRVLVPLQTAAKDNGIYVVAAGAWVRSPDADLGAEVTASMFVPVEEGGVNGDSLWQLVTNGPIVLGATALVFEMLAGRTGVGAGAYTKVTVDKYGRVIAGASPTTIAGYGITDVVGPVITLSVDTVLTSAQMGLVLLDGAGGARTFTLPVASAGLGVVDVIVRRTDNSGNRMVVQAAGTDKIKFHTHLRAEGYPFVVLMGAGDYWHLRSDGAGSWWPIARYDSTPLGRPVLETTTAFSPGGWVGHKGLLYNRAEWPWAWDHAQASGMLTTEALRAGKEGCWTSGDGALTFRSPDARGEFVRVLDELRGIDISRAPGSAQVATAIRTNLQDSYGSDTDSRAINMSLGISTSQSDSKTLATPADAISAFGFPVIDGTANNMALGGQDFNPATSGSVWITTRPRNIAYPGRIKLI